MSLKAFHLVFIAASILLSGGLGVWLVRGFQATGERGTLYLAVLAFIAAVGLLVYGVWFVRKLRGVSYV